MRRTLLIFLTTLLLCACDSRDAPFGLKWSSSIKNFPSKGLLTFNRIKTSDEEEMIYVTTVPKDDLGQGGYRFYFNNNKLIRIVFSTYDFKGDQDGKLAKERYDTIKSILTKRYGSPKKVRESVYSEGFRFIPCVTNENCGDWSSLFEGKNTESKLSIEMGLTEDGYRKTSESSRVVVEFNPN
ncbi:hypothetical protein PQB85_gp21 [Erwinia phage Midgardsormr38]|uniref:Lipoprotein n=1 Tax=Erwinia phage Midgardsormr38 TaxID=2663326 RepID=A0A5Q2F5G3_9CAUD|nr:hypothetical protein PQB85_gp21 [Erwinia phage Midgardsormr38]QGF21978.1 hypothetical protein [Erwinia phage Midgardsormr38]